MTAPDISTYKSYESINRYFLAQVEEKGQIFLLCSVVLHLQRPFQPNRMKLNLRMMSSNNSTESNNNRRKQEVATFFHADGNETDAAMFWSAATSAQRLLSSHF